jgi:hypothetical protein
MGDITSDIMATLKYQRTVHFVYETWGHYVEGTTKTGDDKYDFYTYPLVGVYWTDDGSPAGPELATNRNDALGWPVVGPRAITALLNYVGGAFGANSPLSVPFALFDTDGINPTDFAQVQDLLATGQPSTVPYDINAAALWTPSDFDQFLTVGDATLRLTGELTLTESQASFEGELTLEAHTYDFNAGQRSQPFESMVTFGRVYVPGCSYNMVFTGSKHISWTGPR